MYALQKDYHKPAKLIYPSPHVVILLFFFFCVVKTFKTYSLYRFKICNCFLSKIKVLQGDCKGQRNYRLGQQFEGIYSLSNAREWENSRVS